MKSFLIVVIGILLWQSPDARQFTANTLQTASDIIEPGEESLREKIDSFLD